MDNLKKEHRALRRRPLFTPLAIVIASGLAVVLAAGWLVTSWGSTTVVLVRHAEKLSEGSDPGLSEPGRARAQLLADMLAEAELAAIYVTEWQRTRETAVPVAVASGLEASVIPAAEHKRLMRRLKWGHRGDVVLVIGHSNTVPVIADELGAQIGVLGEEDYAGLWVITYSRLRGTRLLPLRY